MNLSVCLELIFREEQDFARRIRASADFGLPNVEMWTWRDKDLDAIERALGESGAHLVSFVAEPLGGLTDPARHEAFLAGLRESLQVARRFGTRHLILQSGDDRAGVARHEQYVALRNALLQAAPLAEDAGVTLNLEPLNTRVDHPGYFLESTAEGLQLIEEVASPGVRLLYDIYHSVVIDEVPQEILAGHLDLVGHVHLADHPGRHEPGSGSADLAGALAWLQAQGYRGFVGLEFTPSTDSRTALERVLALTNALPTPEVSA